MINSRCARRSLSYRSGNRPSRTGTRCKRTSGFGGGYTLGHARSRRNGPRSPAKANRAGNVPKTATAQKRASSASSGPQTNIQWTDRLAARHVAQRTTTRANGCTGQGCPKGSNCRRKFGSHDSSNYISNNRDEARDGTHSQFLPEAGRYSIVTDRSSKPILPKKRR